MVQFVIGFTNQANEFNRFRGFRKLSIQRPLAESMLTKRLTHLLGPPVSKRDGAEARVRCRQHVVGARTIPGPECSPLDGAPLLARGLGSDWQSGAHRNAAGHKSIAHVKGSFAYRRATLAVRNEKYGNIKLLAERRHKRAR